jgi:tetratricopeptide (TPR) repeat protein
MLTHRTLIRVLAFVGLFLLSLNGVARACIWDYDTLRDEQRGLPGVAEALAGRFEKRSLFFYQDRVARMQAHLQSKPDDLAAIDNYAVALFRVGQTDRAVAVLLDKEKRFPDQYTTASNLATFYMLSGDSASAIPLLEKALRINPDAHFGREEYQLKLARHLVDLAAHPGEIPESDFLGVRWYSQPASMPSGTTRPFVPRIVSRSGKEVDAKAIDAIVGMIRFGTEQSPDLFLALGNQLRLRGDQHLAVRAYSRAIELGHPQADLIREAAGAAVRLLHPESTLEAQIEEFNVDRKQAAVWADAYMAYADQLIRDGRNPDDESLYTAFYRDNGPATPTVGFTLGERIDRVLPRGQYDRSTALLIIILCLGLLAVVLIRSRLRRLRARPRGN